MNQYFDILKTCYVTPRNVHKFMDLEVERLVHIIPNPTSAIKVDYKKRIIRVGTTIKIWFLFPYELKKWEQGRTYLYKGGFYHSGYPISDEQVELSQTMPRGLKLC